MIIGRIFIVPIKTIVKLVINSILGALLLYIINLIGEIWGIHIGINFVTAIIVGILGIPGATLLTILTIFIWRKEPKSFKIKLFGLFLWGNHIISYS